MTDTQQYKSCRVCGRALSVSDWMTSCPHCRAPSPWDVDNGCVMYRAEIAREQAIQAVRDWWQTRMSHREPGIGWKQMTRAVNDLRNNKLMPGSLKQQGNIMECQLTYVPFWTLDAFATGHIKGYNSEPGFEIDFWVPVDQVVTERRKWTRIACDPEAVGFGHLPPETGVIIRPEECQGTAPKTIVQGKDVLARGIEEIRDIAIKNCTVEHVRSKKVNIKPLELILIFYPVWLVKYTFSEHIYTGTIDGMTGKVLSGYAPGDPLLRGIALATGITASALGAAVCIAGMKIANIFFCSPGYNASAAPVSLSIINAVMWILMFSILLFLPVIVIAPICWFFSYRAFAFATHGSAVATGEGQQGFNPEAVKDGGRNGAVIIGVFIGYITMFYGWLLYLHQSIWHSIALVAAMILVYMACCWIFYKYAHPFVEGVLE